MIFFGAFPCWIFQILLQIFVIGDSNIPYKYTNINQNQRPIEKTMFLKRWILSSVSKSAKTRKSRNDFTYLFVLANSNERERKLISTFRVSCYSRTKCAVFSFVRLWHWRLFLTKNFLVSFLRLRERFTTDHIRSREKLWSGSWNVDSNKLFNYLAL